MSAPQDVSHHLAQLRAHSLLAASNTVSQGIRFAHSWCPCLQHRAGMLLWFDVLSVASVLVPGCLQRERAVSHHGAL